MGTTAIRQRPRLIVTLGAVLLGTLLVGCSGSQPVPSEPPQPTPVPVGPRLTLEPGQSPIAVGFGYKTAWLAIRTTDGQAVADALGLINVRSASWADGVNAAYGDESGNFPTKVFVTPPVDGWILVQLGSALFENDGQGRLDFASLSRRFGEVQKFATNRIVEYHEWQRWVTGSSVRRYCFEGDHGEIIFDDGTPAPIEGHILRAAQIGGSWDGYLIPDEQTVVAVASSWSVDPTVLDDRADLAPTGLLGTMPAK